MKLSFAFGRNAEQKEEKRVKQRMGPQILTILLGIFLNSKCWGNPALGTEAAKELTRGIIAAIDPNREAIVVAQDIRAIRKQIELLSEGIKTELKRHHGSAEFQQALIEIQKEGNNSATSWDARNIRIRRANFKEANEEEVDKEEEESFARFERFQHSVLKANEADLGEQKRLGALIETAPPGQIERIKAQLDLKNWESSSRISAQLAELGSVLYALREELRETGPSTEKNISSLANIFAHGLKESLERVKNKK